MRKEEEVVLILEIGFQVVYQTKKKQQPLKLEFFLIFHTRPNRDEARWVTRVTHKISILIFMCFQASINSLLCLIATKMFMLANINLT